MATRVLSRQTITFSIWDNFRMHEEYLRGVGATEEQIGTLRNAAQAVADAEAEDAASGSQDDSLAKALGPVHVGLTAEVVTIAPASPAARYYAGLAVALSVGGREQVSEVEHFHAIIAGLLVFWAYGNGKKALAAAVAQDPNQLAELVGQTMDKATDAPQRKDELVDAYLQLMGVPPAEVKKKRATETYLAMAQTLRRQFAQPTPSGKSS